MPVDAATRRWMRNRSDDYAVENGCKFDEDRGSHCIWWIERFCRLYEGEQADERMVLRGCHQCHVDPEVPDEWNDETGKLYRKRAIRHCKCVRAGHAIDWQYDCLMRLFGWICHSERWGRWVRRFVQASIWVAKKNKKSPTLAAICLYLLIADGEQGQKVFIGAKDGKQAREVAGKHVVEMFLKSKELQEMCKLNQNLMQLTHLETRSILLPLSSSNARTREAKEGINGSVMIDETHVVDREFIGIISRAGISRSEPMHGELSTAGDNPDGYGKERFDLAVMVESGQAKRQELFAAVYAAPQDLSDADLDADPVKWARMANPAMGHTVDPEELLRDYHNSKPSITELGLFKKYRLNIWQHSSNPWLRADDWAKCKRVFTIDDLAGMTAYSGLDLSHTRDLTALAHVFPQPNGRYRLWVDFFMPEKTAEELNHKVPFLQWAKDGWIILTPGGTVDYGFVIKVFRERAAQFKIREFAFDPWHAESTTQAMGEGVVVDGVEIEKGTGIPRVEFRQTIANYAEPVEKFEKAIIDGLMEHSGNPVLDWQRGHIKVYCDANRNKRPIKPKHGDIKTIDGFVAAIMALAVALKNGGVSVYESRGIRTLEPVAPIPELATVAEPAAVWGKEWDDGDDD